MLILQIISLLFHYDKLICPNTDLCIVVVSCLYRSFDIHMWALLHTLDWSVVTWLFPLLSLFSTLIFMTQLIHLHQSWVYMYLSLELLLAAFVCEQVTGVITLNFLAKWILTQLFYIDAVYWNTHEEQDHEVRTP